MKRKIPRKNQVRAELLEAIAAGLGEDEGSLERDELCKRVAENQEVKPEAVGEVLDELCAAWASRAEHLRADRSVER